MADRSADANTHQAHLKDEFLSSIKLLQDAERAAAARIEQARQEAARIESAAREKAVEIASRNSEKIVQIKNEMLAEGRAKAEKEIREILSQANKQASKIRAKKLDEAEIKELAAQILKG
ncbi:MAG: hypothetical protein N3G80_04470 [Candidatus Micrarchaeota archaeon]|nr:hypothetical protein [Candidatus Micrarchaeota archaeon]